MFNNDLQYAKSRMVGSFMLSKDRQLGLVSIAEVRGDNNDFSKSTIWAVTKNRDEIKIKPESLEFSIGKLGYVNQTLSGEALFISRIPIRRDFKQGLRSCQLCSVRANSLSNVNDQWLPTNVKAVSDCIQSVYPDLDQTLENVEEFNTDVAFSKNSTLSSEAVGYSGWNWTPTKFFSFDTIASVTPSWLTYTSS